MITLHTVIILEILSSDHMNIFFRVHSNSAPTWIRRLNVRVQTEAPIWDGVIRGRIGVDKYSWDQKNSFKALGVIRISWKLGTEGQAQGKSSWSLIKRFFHRNSHHNFVLCYYTNYLYAEYYIRVVNKLSKITYLSWNTSDNTYAHYRRKNMVTTEINFIN